MKFFKYILVAAAPLAFILSANAQNAAPAAAPQPVVTETASDSGKVTVTVTDLGNDKKKIEVSIESNKSSSLDTVRDALAAAAAAMPEAKVAISALLASIESSIKNPSAPVSGKFGISLVIEPKNDGSIALSAEGTIGQEKVTANTNTVVADNGVATTSGMVNLENTVTGEVVSNAVNLATNSDGTQIGTVGNVAVAAPAMDVQVANAKANAIMNSSENSTDSQIPDPTIASSGESLK